MKDHNGSDHSGDRSGHKIRALPPWFQDNCVTAVGAKSATQSGLLIRDSESLIDFSPDANAKSAIGKYEIELSLYSTAKLLVFNDIFEDTLSNHRALFFQLPRRKQRTATARAFFSAVIQSLAQDTKAGLVTLSFEDLSNLSEHFARLLKVPEWKDSNGHWPAGLLEYDSSIYDQQSEAVPNRRFWIPFERIVAAPRKKENSTQPMSRVIIHIPGAYSFASDGIGRNVIRYLVTSIHAKLPRATCTMIFTDSESSICTKDADCQHSFHPSPADIISLTGCRVESPVINLAPIETSTLEETLTWDTTVEKHRIHFDYLQKAVRRLKPDSDKEDIAILQPYSELADILYSQIGLVMTKAPSPYLARCLAGIKDWGDPMAILDAVHEAEAIHEAMAIRSGIPGEGTQPNPSSNNGPESIKDKAISAISKIRNSDNEFEQVVRDLIVQNDSLKEGWSDIEIEPDLKRSISQMVELSTSNNSANYGILKKASTKGAVLYGPPGTGKTHLARVLAREFKSAMIHVSAGDVLRKYVGETEQFIQALFAVAQDCAPSIIFLDEADALLKARGDHDRRFERLLISQFLQESDGLERAEHPPFLLLATNNPGDIDEAVLRRVPGRLYIGMPSLEARERMFRIYLKEEILSPLLDISELAEQTARYSGSDIYALCVNAALISESEVMNTSHRGFGSSRRISMLNEWNAARPEKQLNK